MSRAKPTRATGIARGPTPKPSGPSANGGRSAGRSVQSSSGLERWGDIQLLLEVTRAGSFTKAARKLGIEQSTVSRRIALLEQGVGGLLFERQRGKVGAGRPGLTPLGERLLIRAEAVEAGVVAFNDEALGHEQEVEGRVRVALTESMSVHLMIPTLLPLLHELHPGLCIDLHTGYAPADLGHRDAEIAIRFFRPQAGDLVAKRVAHMRTVVLGRKSYVGQALDSLPWVNVELSGVRTPEQAWFARHVSQAPRLITNSYLTQIEAVRQGLGVALLTRSVRLLDPRLVELNLGLPQGPELELWLVTPRTLRQVPRVAAVWSALETALAALDG